MELNTVCRKVTVNENCFNQIMEQNVDFEVNMPDYCGGIQRILTSSVMPYITSKSAVGQSLVIEGNAYFRIIYLDEQDTVLSYEYSTPFTKTIETGMPLDGVCFSVGAKCGYFNTKAVSKRRLEVHSVIEFSLKGSSKRSCEPISDIENGDVYVNRGEVPVTLPICTAEKNIIIEEELELGSAQPAVDGIIRYAVNPTVTGCKLINGKIIVKGELSLEMLYLPEDRKNAEKYTASLPFSQLLDAEGVDEDCVCETTLSVASAELKPRGSYDGEVRSFILNAKITVTATAVKHETLPIIFDAYSPKMEVELSHTDTTVQRLFTKLEETYACKKQLEFSDGDILSVLDVWCNSVQKGYRTEGNSLIIAGTVNTFIMAENSDGTVNVFERPVDFEYKHDFDTLPENPTCEPRIQVRNCAFTISGDNSVELRIDICISAFVFENKYIRFCTAANVKDKDNDEERCEYSLVIYYAEKGERVWDIAKRYNASPDEIIKINSLGEVVEENAPLLIPC